jgi:outer membrane protein
MIMRLIQSVCACSLAIAPLQAQGATQISGTTQPGSAALTLQQAIDVAQRNGHQARAAVSTRDAARARDRAFDARLLPQFSLAGNVPVYTRSIIGVIQPDGSTLYRPLEETRSDINMVVQQQVPFTGATLSMSSRLNKREGNSVPETWNSTPFSVSLSQPIMRSNRIGWDREVNGLQADVAERQYLDAR